MASQIRVVTIRSSGDALRHLRAARGRTREINQPVDIRFEGWPVFSVNVKGRRYKSTLPTSLLRALVEYQDAVNKVHAVTVYESSSSRALTARDRQQLELVFKIEEGSTDGKADLAGWLNTLAQGLTDKLSSRDLMITTLAIALIVSGYFGYSAHLDNRTKALEESNRHELEMELVRNNADARVASDEFARAALNLVRQVPDATSVKVGKQKFDRADIEFLTERARGISVPKNIEGQFTIRSMKSLDGRWSLELVPEGSDISFKTDLFRAERAAESIADLSAAFAQEVPVYLSLSIRERDGVVTYSRITGVGDKSYLPDLIALSDE